MSTLTQDQIDAITARLAAQPNIPAGLGTEEAACSVAAINLALTGELSDTPPACMSLVIARWTIRTQDRMPASMRNSPEWRALLPHAAGTGRDPALERRRAALIVTHMWEVALPLVQPRADSRGYGAEWREMCEQRTAISARKAARSAAYAAYAAYAADAAAYAAADAAAYAAAYAADAYAADAYAADAYAADAYAYAAADAYAYAAADAAAAGTYTYAAGTYAYAYAWKTIDPIDLLRRLVELG